MFIDYDLLEFGDDQLGGWWDMAQSRWRYVREGRQGEGIFFCARRCITLRYTPRYGAETTYSRLRVFCSNGDVSGHLVNSGGVRWHKRYLCRVPFVSPRKNSGIAPILRINSQLTIFWEASSCRTAIEQLSSSQIYHVGIVVEIRRLVRRRILYYSYIAVFREKIFYVEKSILKMYGVRQCNYHFPKLKFGVCVGIVDDSTAGPST